MQGNSLSVAKCRKSFGSHKDRAKESASQSGNHVFGRGFSLNASIDGYGRLLRRFPRSLQTHGHPRAATERLIDDAISLSQFHKPRLLVRSCVRVQDDAKPDLFEADRDIFLDPQRATNIEVKIDRPLQLQSRGAN